LTELTRLPNLESVFAQLVQQQDTRSVAQQILEVIRIPHV
jgi:ABC-2 type transport system ATP-binding protein